MKKKLKIVKNNSKGFPKDMTTAAAASAAAAKEPKTPKAHDSRIPAAGTTITRKYKGEELKVKVLESGFEYKGQIFKSISAAAVHIVGGPVSGYVFFKLGDKNEQRGKTNFIKQSFGILEQLAADINERITNAKYGVEENNNNLIMGGLAGIETTAQHLKNVYDAMLCVHQKM